MKENNFMLSSLSNLDGSKTKGFGNSSGFRPRNSGESLMTVSDGKVYPSIFSGFLKEREKNGTLK